jgi:hypothetical protein
MILRTCGNLVADCCEHEAEGYKELCSSRIELFNDCRHIPLEATPEH